MKLRDSEVPKIRQDPQTPAEWQEAVDAAAFLLALDSCRLYGLVETDIEIDELRALDLIKRGLKLGIRAQSLETLTRKFIE